MKTATKTQTVEISINTSFELFFEVTEDQLEELKDCTYLSDFSDIEDLQNQLFPRRPENQRDFNLLNQIADQIVDSDCHIDNIRLASE
tara:strand:- start:1049 stop:1312 length:264 start_codon:yes stop_codon:yes gene_type:complete